MGDIAAEKKDYPEKEVASVAVFNPEGKLLFGQRHDNGKWTLPSGHLEPDERPEIGAARELREETGLIPESESLKLLGNDVVIGQDGTRIRVHAFRCNIPPGQDVTYENDPDAEFIDHEWVDPEFIPAYILDNLHSPKNVCLRMLGLQDWEKVEEKERLQEQPQEEGVGGQTAEFEPPHLQMRPEPVLNPITKAQKDGQPSLELDHYSPLRGLRRLDPTMQGTGAFGIHAGEAQRENRIPRTYYYRADTEPEQTFKSGHMQRYRAKLPKGAMLYDIARDPEGLLKTKAKRTSEGVQYHAADLSQVEKHIRKLGYFGYKNYHPTIPHAIAVFYPLDATPMAKSSKYPSIEDSLVKSDVDVLLEHPSRAERQMALKMKGVTAEHLRRAASDPDAQVALTALQHPLVDAATLTQALAHAAPSVRIAAAKHPRADASHMDQAMTDANPLVRQALADSPNLEPQHLATLMESGDPQVLERLARHPHITPEMAVGILVHPRVSAATKLAVAQSPHVPASLRKSLEPQLQELAKKAKLQEPMEGQPSQQLPPKPQSKLRAVKPQPEPNLVPTHNLTQEKLLHAHKLGGLVAPSIAVAHKDHPLTGFGEVTLVGSHKLIDPKQGVPVYDADVYSPRHPRANYNVNAKAYKKFGETFGPAFKELQSDPGRVEEELRRGGAQAVIDDQGIRKAMGLAFLREKGHQLEAPEIDVPTQHAVSHSPALQEFVKTHGIDQNFEHGSDYHQALSEAIRQGLLQNHDTLVAHGTHPDSAKDLYHDDHQHFFGNGSNGNLSDFGPTDSLLHDLTKVGKKQKDTSALKKLVEGHLTASGLEPEFNAWAKQHLQALEGDPYIPKHTYDGRTRKVAYTPENILKEMTKKIRGGENFNYGLGTARSMGAKKFRTLDEIGKSRGQIVSSEEFTKHKEAMQERFHQLLSRLVPNPGMDHMDRFAQAIGDSYKRGQWLGSTLKANGLPDANNDPDLRADIHQFAEDLKNSPTEYFEAKPQRVVGLNEFHGAVVPHDVRPEVLEALQHHGIQHIERYPRNDDKARGEAIQRIAFANKLMLTELAKGAMTRVAPYNPAHLDQRLPRPQEAATAHWQGGLNVGAGDRAKVPQQEGPARVRALHKLTGIATARRNPKTGEREFLLHRGVGSVEHQKATTAKPGMVTHEGPTSWTPWHFKAKHFSEGYGQQGYSQGNAMEQGQVLSAWVPESHIRAIPEQWGRLDPKADQLKQKNRVYASQIGPNAFGGIMDPEHEVIVEAGSRPMATAQEVARHKEHAQANLDQRISASGGGVDAERHHQHHVATARNPMFKGEDYIKFRQDLAKGAMQRLAPFNPQSLDQRPDETGEASTARWQHGDSDEEQDDRGMIPTISGTARTRALHKLHSMTATRRNPETGRREFLLHRGVSRDEHAQVTSGGPARIDHDEPSSWTPKYSLARNFAKDYAQMNGSGGLDQPKVLSAWVDEDNIDSVPRQWGALDLDADINFDQEGYKPPKGPNDYASEHEIIVRGGHNSVAASPQELAVHLEPVNSIHGRVNMAGDLVTNTRLLASRLRHGRGLGKADDESVSAEAAHQPGGAIRGERSEDVMPLADPDFVADFEGHHLDEEQYFEAARFLAGKTERIPPEDLRRFIWQEDGDTQRAALRAYGLEADDLHIKALQGVLAVVATQADRREPKRRDYFAVHNEAERLGKAEGSKDIDGQDHMAFEAVPRPPHAQGVTPLTPSAEDVAEVVRNSYRHERVEAVELKGKHSKGTLIAHDPESHDAWLLKPGSGAPSPAAGIADTSGTQSQREAAFYACAKFIFGLGDNLPRCELLNIDGQEIAAMRFLPPEFRSLEKRAKEDSMKVLWSLHTYLKTGTLHKWAVMDWVLGNVDRHGQNILANSGQPERLFLIDHGSTFAGVDFDPAHDQSSFVPYYLRAWSPRKFNSLPADEKLRRMPRADHHVEVLLRDWIAGLNSDSLKMTIAQFGLDPDPSLKRLAKVKALVSDPKVKDISEAIDALWV